ncbi:MAG TPA: lipopolysaccharide heptosyltransferase I [Thermoanaerobaculia bacterium]|nr:lipopolysaccharide heptosyltransferase I [Thermoanaerobaculia bacterium]
MKRLLVLRLSALGDVIHTIPAVTALREANPGAQISWVVEAPYRELVEIVAGVEAIPVRMKRWSQEPRTALASIRSLRGAGTSVDFQGLIKSAVLGWLSGAKERFGFDRDAVREKPALLFTNRKIAIDTTKHVIDQNVELAAAVIGPMGPMGEKGQEASCGGNWDTFAQAKGLEALAGSVVLLPGAGKPSKLWPVDHFRALARRIGPEALVVWGPGERELAEAIGARMAPPTNLRELAWVLKNARVVIGADTGPLHLAVALGTPVIGLYGPTDPRRNGPYGQLDRVINRFHSTKLMDSISVEDVVTMLGKVTGE